jgi:hypothetical protein
MDSRQSWHLSRTSPVALVAAALLAAPAVAAGAGSAPAPSGCPTPGSSGAVGFGSSGGVVAAAPVASVRLVKHVAHPAAKHRLRRHRATHVIAVERGTPSPGQMPPFFVKKTLNPACVPTPTGVAPAASAPAAP